MGDCTSNLPCCGEPRDCIVWSIVEVETSVDPGLVGAVESEVKFVPGAVLGAGIGDSDSVAAVVVSFKVESAAPSFPLLANSLAYLVLR